MEIMGLGKKHGIDSVFRGLYSVFCGGENGVGRKDFV